MFNEIKVISSSGREYQENFNPTFESSPQVGQLIQIQGMSEAEAADKIDWDYKTNTLIIFTTPIGRNR